MSWLSRLANVFRSERLNRELEDEARFHIEERTGELVRRGMTQREAERSAWRQFGNRLLLRESSREAKLLPWLESIVQDVRFGLRMLRKDRVVTLAAILSLSLAIGACTAAFSLIDALILRPLPVHEPERLVYLAYPGWHGEESDSFSYPLFERIRDLSSRHADFFGISGGGPLQQAVFDGSGGEAEKVRAQWISVDGFAVLGIQPALGRLLSQPSSAVLSHAFWMRRFGGSPAVLGRWITFNGRQYQIAGVAQKGFSGLSPGELTDLWVPITTRADARALLSSDEDWVEVWGRLKAGVAPEQVRQILQPAFTGFRREQAKRLLPPNAPSGQIAKFIHAPLALRSAARGSGSLLRRLFARPLWILAGVVGLVLLIACSNVANLLIARAAAREREMATRISIGAGRMRLMQQLLIESSLLALAACVIGLCFASAAAPSIVNLLTPSDYPAYLDLHVEWRVLAFLALMGVSTTVLFGIAPAVRASAVRPAKAGLLRPLLAAQVGFSFVVLFVAGLLLLSFQKLTHVELGFSKTGVLLFTIGAKDLESGGKARVATLQLLDQVRQLPAVQGASLSGWGLVGGPFAPRMVPAIRMPGREPESSGVHYLEVSPAFFETMQIRLLDGREFVPRDIEPESASVIVNQAFAQHYFPAENPIGRRFERRGDDAHHFLPQEIVGVAADAKYNNLREPVSPTVYEPLRRLNGVTLEVRTTIDPITIAGTLREEIQRGNPSIRVTSVTLQSTRIENTLLRERLLALLSGFFAVVAVVLAAVGLYGVISYAVVRRTKEIGIRMALGARKFGVVRLVISDMAMVTAVGLAAGMAGGIALSRLIASLLFEVKPSDFWSLALPLAALLLASVLAALPPSLRAAGGDPMVALRYE